MNRTGLLYSLFFSLLILTACRKDKPADKIQAQVQVQQGGVFISNEGNFQYGNAKISYYNPADNSVTEDLFEPANNSKLGDVCQSLYFFNGKVYIVVNNSGKIEIVNEKTFVRTGTITGLNSPRYFQPVSNAKAFVSDLYANKLYVVDLNSLEISNQIPLAARCEEMAMIYGKVFVCCRGSNKVYIVDAASEQLTDSIPLTDAPGSIVEDKNGKLWVMCSGKTGVSQAALYCINPQNKQVEKTLTFTQPAASPWRLNINRTGDTLYYLDNGVYRMPVSATQLPQQAFVSQGSHLFYGLGIHPESSDVYVSDAIDYVQKGQILRFSSEGAEKQQFKAGIIPGHFYFR